MYSAVVWLYPDEAGLVRLGVSGRKKQMHAERLNNVEECLEEFAHFFITPINPQMNDTNMTHGGA